VNSSSKCNVRRGTSYIPPVKPILLLHDYEELRISRIFGNTPPACFQIFSSADSLALPMSPRLIVTIIRHLHTVGPPDHTQRLYPKRQRRCHWKENWGRVLTIDYSPFFTHRKFWGRPCFHVLRPRRQANPRRGAGK